MFLYSFPLLGLNERISVINAHQRKTLFFTPKTLHEIDYTYITEGIDTSTAMGKLWFSMNAIMAENERTVQMEQSGAGLVAARQRGRIGGRPKGLTEESERKMKAVKKLYGSGVSISEIRKTLDIASNATVYKYIRYKHSPHGETDKGKPSK